jgi:hypothetical protein
VEVVPQETQKVWPQTTSSLQRAAYDHSDLAGPRIQTFSPHQSPKKACGGQFLDASLKIVRTCGSPNGDSLHTQLVADCIIPGTIDFDSNEMPEFEMAEPVQYYQTSEITAWCADEIDPHSYETEDHALELPYNVEGNRLAEHLQPEAAFAAALSLADEKQPVVEHAAERDMAEHSQPETAFVAASTLSDATHSLVVEHTAERDMAEHLQPEAAFVAALTLADATQPLVVEHTAERDMPQDTIILQQISDTSAEAEIHQPAEYGEQFVCDAMPEWTAACPEMPQLAKHLIVESAFAHVSPNVVIRDPQDTEQTWSADDRKHEHRVDAEEVSTAEASAKFDNLVMPEDATKTSARRWYLAYVEHYKYAPKQPEHLTAFVKWRGGYMTYKESKDWIAAPSPHPDSEEKIQECEQRLNECHQWGIGGC